MAKMQASKKTMTASVTKAPDTTTQSAPVVVIAETTETSKETTEVITPESTGNEPELNSGEQTPPEAPPVDAPKHEAPAPEVPVVAPIVEAPIEPLVAIAEPALVTKIKQRLEDYISKMSSNVPQNPVSGGFQQRNLLMNVFLAVLSHDEAEEARQAMSTISEIFAQYRTQCFNESLSYRFLSTNSLSTEQSQLLRTLLSVFIATADRNSRGQAIKQIDWRKVTKQLNHERCAANLMHYFYPS